MKTAMQELRDDLIQIFNDNNIPIILQIDKYIEKEKEQIIEANIAGMEFIPVDPNKYQQDAEQHYNQTYNQNK
jgi:phosphoglycerate-specific signal transduction histidine kinase